MFVAIRHKEARNWNLLNVGGNGKTQTGIHP